MNLAEKVKQRRTELGLSQDELAKMMGYTSRSSINKIEKGRPISQKIVHKLAESLNVPFSYLMGIETEEKQKIGSPIPLLNTAQTINTSIEADFCLYATDQTMKYVHINKNDLVFFKKTSQQVKSGTIIAVQYKGETLIRIFYQYDHLLVLRNADDHPKEIVCRKEDITILGKAVSLQRKL